MYDPNNLSALTFASDGEEWRAVGLFEVSSLGRARNQHGRILKGDRPSGTYRRVTRGAGRKGPSAFVHQLVCEAWHGPRPTPQHLALHRDDDPFNDVPSNLYWGTAKDNAADRYRNGKSRAHLDSRAVQIIRFEVAKAKRLAKGKRVARGTIDRLSVVFRVSKEVVRSAVRAYQMEPRDGL